MRFAIIGPGRMGAAIEAVARSRGHVCGARLGREAMGEARFEAASLGEAAIAFEFSEPGAARANVDRLLAAGVRVVCGTTGWSVDDALRRAADDAGLIVASNFSLGMHVFQRVLRVAARELGRVSDYDPYVAEWHHRGKRDAPSGTARRIAEIVLAEDSRRDAWVPGASGDGRRDERALPVASVRAGHEPGRHTVGWDGAHDEITLTHRARGRGGFAEGAVLAGEWLVARRGYHAFEEVVASMLDEDRSSESGPSKTRPEGDER